MANNHSSLVTVPVLRAADLRPRPHAVPLPLTCIAMLAVAYCAVIVVSVVGRVPYAQLGSVLTEPATTQMLRVTLASSALATLISTLLGVALALWLHSHKSFAPFIRALALIPLALPPVVAGLALTAAFGRTGLLAPLLSATGISLVFTFAGVVATHVFICLPFVVVSIDTALRHLEPEVMDAARDVGIGPWARIIKILLPSIAPGIATGMSLAFARSLGEFGATITFAGSLPGQTRTLSLGLYVARESSLEQAYALSAIVVGLALAALTLGGLITWLLRRTKTDSAHTATTAAASQSANVAALLALTEPTPTIPGTTVALLGPNGSGKTTLVHYAAGRLRARATSTQQASRNVVLSQKPSLPPFATTVQALSMVTKSPQTSLALLDAAGLGSLAHIRVRNLSGGQAAQIALLRALAAHPATLYIDEPFAALDVERTQFWRRYFEADTGRRTTVIITHDPVDVMCLAQEVLVLDGGQVIEQGSASTLLSQPQSSFLAQLLGLRLIHVHTTEHGVSSGSWNMPLTHSFEPGTPAVLALRPDHVTTCSHSEHLQLCSTIRAKVESIELSEQGTVIATLSSQLGSLRMNSAPGLGSELSALVGTTLTVCITGQPTMYPQTL